MLASMCLFLCLHLLPMSLLLLMFLGFLMFFSMYSFSDVHRSHVSWDGFWVVHFFKIFHFMLGVGCRLLSQIYCESVVLVLLFISLKLCIWLLYLVLNSPSVAPIYCSCCVEAL